MQLEDLPTYDLGTADVAQLLGIDRATVNRWADAGALAHIRTPGGHRRFRRADVEAFLDRSRREAVGQ